MTKPIPMTREMARQTPIGKQIAQALLETERLALWNVQERILVELDYCGELIEHPE